jgi:hypothetical protein
VFSDVESSTRLAVSAAGANGQAVIAEAQVTVRFVGDDAVSIGFRD